MSLATEWAQPRDWGALDERELDHLFRTLYRELHLVARGQKRRLRWLDTLNTTALVHEAYLKLADRSEAAWDDGAHFRAIAATAMRHILINYAERKAARKRGGASPNFTLDDLPDGDDDRSGVLLELDQAMTELEQSDPRLARIVDCRFFAGLTEAETAKVVGVTERTVRRDWVRARTLLAAFLCPPERAAGLDS
jgi:RNA polymerase sigma factor (TIGR02999 family)